MAAPAIATTAATRNAAVMPLTNVEWVTSAMTSATLAGVLLVTGATPRRSPTRPRRAALG